MHRVLYIIALAALTGCSRPSYNNLPASSDDSVDYITKSSIVQVQAKSQSAEQFALHLEEESALSTSMTVGALVNVELADAEKVADLQEQSAIAQALATGALIGAELAEQAPQAKWSQEKAIDLFCKTLQIMNQGSVR
jgi:hypothetical protein